MVHVARLRFPIAPNAEAALPEYAARRSPLRRVLPSGERVSPHLRHQRPARRCIHFDTVCDPACDSGYFSAALILFGASHTFWHYPLRALFATRPKHPKPAQTPASTPDPNHARSTTNPSNSLFYLVKLGTEGFCSHSRFCIKMSVLVVELAGLEPATLCLQSRCATSCAIAP